MPAMTTEMQLQVSWQFLPSCSAVLNSFQSRDKWAGTVDKKIFVVIKIT